MVDETDAARVSAGEPQARKVPNEPREGSLSEDYQVIHGIMGKILPDIYKRVRRGYDASDATTLYMTDACSELTYLAAKGMNENGAQAEAVLNDEAAYPDYIGLIDQPNFHALVSAEMSGRKYFIDPNYGQFLRVLGVRDLPDENKPSLGGATGGEYIIFPATEEGARQVIEWMTEIVRIHTTRNRIQMPPNARSATTLPLSEMRELLLRNYNPAKYEVGDSEWEEAVIEVIENNAATYEQEKILESLGLPQEADTRSLYPAWDVQVTPSSVILTGQHGGNMRVGRYTLLPDGRVMFNNFINISDLSILKPEDGTPVEDGVARDVLRILKKGEESR